jgi:hypothetical protein
MFYSMSLPEKTQIFEFCGRLDDWGSIVRTIRSTPGGFTCMTTIGHSSTVRIAAACNDGTVGIYDSVTGVLRLSISPPHPIQVMTGSPDGSVLFCTHRESPSITLWDIQTGGLIHTFILTTEATDTVISPNGRYLAYGLSDNTVNVWEIASRTGGPVFEGDSPITCLCWLAPEEQLMVANGASVHIQDIVTGSVLVRSFEMRDPVCGAAYSQDFNQLAVVTSSGADSSITLIDTQTGAPSGSRRFQQQLFCPVFSQVTEDLICGTNTPGLVSINVRTLDSRDFDLVATITSVSTLSNGTVVANVAGSGIQLLSLDEGSAPSRGLIPPTLTVHPLDQGRIIAIIPTNRDRVVLLEAATMSQVLEIPAQGNLSVPTDRAVVLCASLENKIAVHCFAEGGKECLELWKSACHYPQWTAQVDELPSAGSISPACARLVTFHCTPSRSYVRVLNVRNGALLAELDVDLSPCPLDITFDSEDKFHVNYDTSRTTGDIVTLFGTASYAIVYHERVPFIGKAQENQYRVDDSHEWVISGLQRICWIPTGYIGSTHANHCWAGSSLVMVGQDGTFRKLTLCGLS